MMFASSVKVLTSPSAPTKMHMEIELPPTVSYAVGDHLIILPINPTETVQRVLARFRLGGDSVLDMPSVGSSTLPPNTRISATDLFGQYLELSHPASTNVSFPPFESFTGQS